jgi:hypothetical protein
MPRLSALCPQAVRVEVGLMQCSRVVMIVVGVVTCESLHDGQRDNVARKFLLGGPLTTGYAFFLSVERGVGVGALVLVSLLTLLRR